MGEQLRWAVGFCVLCIAGLLSTACGGDSGSTSCGSTSACGGDPTGTWKIQHACAESTAGADPSCPAASINTSGLSVSGSFSFNADKTYSSSLTEGGSLVYTIPNSCLTMNGVTVTCSELGQLTNSGATFSSVSCSASGASCICKFALKETTATETGTYAVSGTQLSTQPSNGTPTTDGFCATSTELHLFESDMTMGSAAVTGQIFATKQ